ncbi:hypothetical protein GHT09_013273 [Marmota monax]|uniref:Uncharacterized protein n=1 Tax=Marmota monax TaxID=9995 RepID=A0A834PLL1_MARMO|nr:hypothetical protein GHT09_013273 [Marmota monax]
MSTELGGGSPDGWMVGDSSKWAVDREVSRNWVTRDLEAVVRSCDPFPFNQSQTREPEKAEDQTLSGNQNQPIVGFFSNVSSAFEKCHPWTSCETKDLVEHHPGTNVTDAICGFQSRTRALVVIPIVGVLLLAIFLVSLYIRESPGKVLKKPKDKAVHFPKAQGQDPVEIIFLDDVAPSPAAPVQETLHGCQPVTQEDGKESRVAVQERQ